MNKILDLIYPPVCGVCGKLDKNSICKKCEIRLNRQAIFGIDDYSRKMRFFSEHIYIFKYDGEIRKMLLKYKFNDKSYIYHTFVNFLKKNEKICVQIKKYDIIIPVPISLKRFKQRGYNQSKLIAKKMAKVMNLNYADNVLIKTKNNIAQSLLEEHDRECNVNGVYELKNSKKIKQKNILLIDDIYTTGSTVNECSRILKKADVNKIGIFTLAKD